jgi:hypothetical protein
LGLDAGNLKSLIPEKSSAVTINYPLDVLSTALISLPDETSGQIP